MGQFLGTIVGLTFFLGTLSLTLYAWSYIPRKIYATIKLSRGSKKLQKRLDNPEISFFVEEKTLNHNAVKKLLETYRNKTKEELTSNLIEWLDYEESDPRGSIFKYPMINTYNVSLIEEPKGTEDETSIIVIIDKVIVGYVPEELTEHIQKNLDKYVHIGAKISEGVMNENIENQEVKYKIEVIGIK